MEGLFNTLAENVMLQHSEIILSLQYYKLVWQSDRMAEEWVSCLRIKVIGCKNKKKDRIQKEQIINGINNQAMMTKIIKELTAIMNTSKATIEEVLSWEKEIEAQRSQKAMLDSLNYNAEFGMISQTKCKMEPDHYIENQTGTPKKRNI